jgi:DNA-binding response OmpR family regulator
MNNPPLILIADDDWMNRELLEAHLQGYEIISVNSGEKALELAHARLPDLVIVDVRMPRMTGYEVCTHLREAEATRNIPVLIFSALEGDGAKQMALEAGADDVLPKPFTGAILQARVRNLLRIKALHDELQRRESNLWNILTQHLDETTAHSIMEDWLKTNV